ncbi:MAG: pyrroline-5-carboxylate reductase [Pseudomonadota bacterium]
MATAKLAFIGAGNIAQALIGGLINDGIAAGNILAIDPSNEQLARLPGGVSRATAAAGELLDMDAIVICVKPGLVARVAADLGAAVANKLIISVAAGITTATLAESIGGNPAIIRCMPNTPALVGTGMTGLFASPGVTTTQKQLAELVLGAVGEFIWFDREADLDAVTAVSGSGPAYFFLVMEVMQKAAESLGLAPETSQRLVLQTALGAARMAMQGPESPAQLRRNVTSPGGTTEAAINSLLAAGIEQAFADALHAAAERSRELAGTNLYNRD